MAPATPKLKGICKGYPPRDNSKGGPLGKENRHCRSISCVETFGGGGAVKPLAERQNSSLSLPDQRNNQIKVTNIQPFSLRTEVETQV